MTVFDDDIKPGKGSDKPELKKSFPVKAAESLIFYVVAWGFISMLAIPLFRLKPDPFMIAYLLLPFLALYIADFIFTDPISSILALMPFSVLLGAASYLLLREEAAVIYVIGFYVLVVSHRVIARMSFDFIRLAAYAAVLMFSYVILCSIDAIAARYAMYGFFFTIVAGAVIASASSFEKAVADESSEPEEMKKTGGIRLRLAFCAGAVVACATLISLTAGGRLSEYDKPVSQFIVNSVPGMKLQEKDAMQVVETLKKMKKGPGDLFPKKGPPSIIGVILFLAVVFMSVMASIAGPILLALFLVNLWRFLLGRDRSKNEDVRTQSIFSVREMKERVKSRFLAGRKRRIPVSRSDKMRIRKLYREIVMRVTSDDGVAVVPSSTPREIEKLLGLSGRVPPSDAANVTAAYERARYTTAENAREDLEMMRGIHDATGKRRNP